MKLFLQDKEKVLYQDGPRGIILVLWFFRSLFITIFLSFLLSWIPGISVFAILSLGINEFLIYYLLFFVVLFIIVFLYHIALRKTFKYYVTTDRVVFMGGIILRKIRSVPFHKITDASISQNIIERILGIYKVNIHTAGTGTHRPEIQFVGIREPEKAQSLVLRELKKFKASRQGAAYSE